MTVLATLLIVAAAVLLLALVAGLWWQRQGARAVPAGPRTVAELVSKRAAATALAGAEAAVDRSWPAATVEPVATGPGPVGSERHAEAEPVAARPVVPEPSAPVDKKPREVPVGPVPLGVDRVGSDHHAVAVAPLGDDVPWRRATQMAGRHRDPEPDIRRPALALLRRPVRRAPVPTRPEPVPAVAAPPAAVSGPVEVPVAEVPVVEVPVVEVPVAEVPVMPEPMGVTDPAPVPRGAVVAVPDTDPDVRSDPATVAAAEQPDESGPRPRDRAHLAAEQAAADLALLRTFGPSDLASRPDRAPVVALEGRGRPEPIPAPGAEQPVRFRAVRRDGTVIADVAVALLDDRGREIAVDKADAAGAGELRAPHPGSYVLVATAPDHQPGAVTLTVGDGPVDADVLLVRSASLAGLVTGEDGPIDGARITLVQDGEVVDTADTDPDGRYRVPDMAAGEYALSAAAAGCEANVVLVSIPDEAELVHDVDLAPAGVAAG